MALTYDDVSGIVQTSIRPRVQTNWKNKSVLAMYLTKEGRKKPNMERITNGVKYPIFYTTNGGEKWFTKDDPLPNPQSPTTTAAEFAYKHAAAGIGVYGTDAAQVTGQDAIDSFINIRKQNALDGIWNLVGKSSYSGAADGAKELIGLDAIFDNDPYGKLTKADVLGPDGTTVWAAKTLTKATVTIADLIKQFGKTWDGGSDRSDLGMTHPDVWMAICAKLQPQERYMTDVGHEDVRNAGYVALNIMQCPVYADTYCLGTTGSPTLKKFYFLQTQYLDMFIHPDRNFTVDGPIPTPEMDGKVWRILFSGNVACNRRARQLRWDGIDPDL